MTHWRFPGVLPHRLRPSNGFGCPNKVRDLGPRDQQDHGDYPSWILLGNLRMNGHLPISDPNPNHRDKCPIYTPHVIVERG